MLVESTSMGMPRARKMMARRKNMMMVLVRVGTGCQALSICCLNWCRRPSSSASLEGSDSCIIIYYIFIIVDYQPGGQFIFRPPNKCICRWETVC